MSVAKTIHVALASDENYFEGLLTTAWTIVRNCSRPQSIIFHILDGGISKSSFDYIVSAVGVHRSTDTILTKMITLDPSKHIMVQVE